MALNVGVILNDELERCGSNCDLFKVLSENVYRGSKGNCEELQSGYLTAGLRTEYELSLFCRKR
jgi:hypothetical protein